MVIFDPSGYLKKIKKEQSNMLKGQKEETAKE